MRSLKAFVLVLLVGCGDLKFDENNPTSPNAPPPGSSTLLGSLSAMLDNEQFNAPLQTPATWRNDNFGFTVISALAGLTRMVSISIHTAGPVTAVVGGIPSPSVSLNESVDGINWLHWGASSRQGAGSVTLSFLTTESASGYFSVELIPDSATKAAGYTTTRYLTGGNFNVSVSR